MRCDRCGRDAIVLQRYSGLRLCGDHLRAALEARARGTLRARGWIRPGDRIAVALSGGRSSCSLLRFLSAQFGMRRDLSLVAVTVDEGCPARDMGRIRDMAGRMGVGWAGTSFAEEFGDAPGGIPASGDACLSPSSSARLLDRALGSLAARVGATKLALGTNLDDAARAVFLKVLRGEGSGLVTAARPPEGGISRITPFLRISDEELALYARLNLLDPVPAQSPRDLDPMEREAMRLLEEYAHRHPSALFSLVNLGEALMEARTPPPGRQDHDPGTGEPAVPGRAAPARGGRVTGHG
jgi:tRNA(Ile)-lysidine synthase TilS/MesJ